MRDDNVRKALQDVLDCFWDMSPLEYAHSRGLSCMSDEEGERVKERARTALQSTNIADPEPPQLMFDGTIIGFDQVGD